MKSLLKITALFTLLILIKENVIAQGCSDAGFCTIGNLAQQQTNDTKKQKFTLQLPAGIGDEEVFVFSPAIQYDNQVSKKWAVQAKLTANYANGNLGSAAGLGDVFLSGTYIFPNKKNDWNLSATIGSKLPLSQANLDSKGRSLPMQYQSSLGTIDLITGVALSNKKWQFAAGWQQPLSGINGNNFLPTYFNNNEAEKYIPSNDFNRKGDVLLRGLYKYSPGNRLRLNGGLLGIYHLGEDTYIDGNVSNKPIAIKGSDGLTLNASVASWYSLSKKITLGLSAALPLVIRDVRPDGLTRSFVVSPEISWSF